MKRFLLWSFERGSIQYDVICVIILAFIFLTPTSFFNDRPDFMRVPGEREPIRRGRDDRGNTVYTVRVPSAWSASAAVQQAAQEELHGFLGQPVRVARVEPIYNTLGGVTAFAFWIER